MNDLMHDRGRIPWSPPTWLFTAQRAHDIADERLREAQAGRLAAAVPRSSEPGRVRRGLARAAATASRVSADLAHTLDARSLEDCEA